MPDFRQKTFPVPESGVMTRWRLCWVSLGVQKIILSILPLGISNINRKVERAKLS